MELLTALEYFHYMTHIPMVARRSAETVREYSVGRFEPNLAEFFCSSIYSDEASMDITISKDFLMCAFMRDKSDDTLVYVGPVMEYPCTKATARSVLKQIGQPDDRTDALIRYMERIPRLSMTRFVRSVLFLNYIINDENPPEWHVNEKILSFIKPEADIQRANNVVHNSQAMDGYITGLVQFGKVDELTKLLKNEMLISGNMGLTANNSLRAYKNVFVVTAYAASRAAVKGGLDYEIALDVSDEYLQEMERLDNYDDVHALWRQILMDFTSQVAKIRKLNATSQLMQQVVGYVGRHIYERILIEDVAEESGYNRSYICRAFKKETGKNLSAYINETKMEEARYLLAATDKPVVEVAVALGFSTQNHFQTIFKEIVGKTPAQYRKDPG
jgi:AraC-like DNA-binding protein